MDRYFISVFRIRIPIHRIRLFLGLPDPHPGYVKTQVRIRMRIRLRILLFSHKSVERTEIMVENFGTDLHPDPHPFEVRIQKSGLHLDPYQIVTDPEHCCMLYSTLPHLPPLRFHYVGGLNTGLLDFGYKHSARSHPR
jgi:hypothetical protein